MPGKFLSLFQALLSITKEAGRDESSSGLLVYSSTTNTPLEQVKVILTTWPYCLLCPPPEASSPMSPLPCPHSALVYLTLFFSFQRSLPFPAYLKPHTYMQPWDGFSLKHLLPDIILHTSL